MCDLFYPPGLSLLEPSRRSVRCYFGHYLQVCFLLLLLRSDLCAYHQEVEGRHVWNWVTYFSVLVDSYIIRLSIGIAIIVAAIANMAVIKVAVLFNVKWNGKVCVYLN